METPEEKSSEVTEEQELTQEALDAANTEEETPAEVEPETFGPKAIAEISRQRTAKQDALVAAARAEGKLEALQGQQATTATVSPLQTAKAAYIAENGDLEGFTMTVDLYEADSAFKDAQVTKAADVKATQELGVLQVASMNTAKLVHDDWQETISAGQSLLSNGEAIDVAAAGRDFGEVAYEKCKAAIARSKPVTKDEAAPEKELSKSEAEAKVKAEAKAKTEELEGQEKLLEKRIKHPNPAVEAALNL